MKGIITNMMTFEQARRAVRPVAEKNWNPGMGTLVIATKGFQSQKLWRVRAIAKQELDGDLSFTQMDELIYLVSKSNGAVIVTTYLINPEMIDAMRPYPAS